MQPTPYRPAGRWSAFAPGLFALGLMAAVVIYLWSVLDASRGPQDWLMILPAGLVCIAALLWAGGSDVVRESRDTTGAGSERDSSLLPPALLVLICLYAPAAGLIGFDIATAIFIPAALVLQGERRPVDLGLASLGGTALLMWVFLDLLAVRLPVTVL
ncbi:tripartite tricarboxylate transporter TctB family protein (plasmid) [Roseivivax marinus]|uniref:tripartite tricarboxylate transporter TctB family protein n=1 Tax=Roseivivax marinus TaxID=1379903 RepID=UPI001F0343A0|nr:tripartite tricarboxylate transporter TctB family protein [Roseivivax marinus]UMA66775.1 tripartite tricarboxylate transporter TctB family protein [Roseivivax marinus]